MPIDSNARNALTSEQINVEWQHMRRKIENDPDRVLAGFVYIVELGGFYKIGYTKDVKKRIKQMCEIQLPWPFNLVFSFECQTPKLTELHVHAQLDEFRVRGEWFELDKKHLDWAAFLIAGFSQMETDGDVSTYKIYSDWMIGLRAPYWEQYSAAA